MKRAFTLIELLVVIAIIGILATVVVVNLGGARQKSRYAKMVSDLKGIDTALQLYYDQNGSYPADDTVYPGVLSQYISSWPIPPCQGWVYDYQQWGEYISVWVWNGKGGGAAFYPFQYPLQNGSWFLSPPDIRYVSDKKITCNE